MHMFYHVIIALLCISYTTPAPSTLSPPNTNPVTDRLSLWFSYAQRGFKSVAASIVGLKRGMLDERERVSTVVDDIRGVEKNQQSLLKLLQQTVSDVQAVNSSLVYLDSLQPRCTEGWTLHNQNCYRFTQCSEKPPCTTNYAAEQCRANASMLASVRSEEENLFMSSLMPANVTYMYIGGRDDVTEGEWRWGDGTRVVNPHWRKGEPNNCCGGQHCMVMWRGSTNNWDDYTCTHPYHQTDIGYMCQASAWKSVV